MPFANNILAGNATIDYARMLHLSNSFASKQFGIGKLINLPWFINIGGSAGSSPYIWIDPDGQDWYTRVVSAGGTITNANQAAFDTAFQALKSTNGNDGNSLWSHVSQGYWFIGQEALTNGLMVPFYRSDVSGGSAVWGQSATNNNYTSYTKTGGLVGDGSTTFVATTINNNNNTNWPVSSGSIGRMAYVYMANTGAAGFMRGFHPFGSEQTARAFDCQLNATGAGNNISYRISNNSPSQAAGTFTVTGWQDGGWGVISNQSVTNRQIVICGTGRSYVLSLSTPASTALTDSLMKIGKSGNSTSECNIKCAILGSRWNYTSNPNAFSLIDGIVNTLVASLT
jgi:hypothetical protein